MDHQNSAHKLSKSVTPWQTCWPPIQHKSYWIVIGNVHVTRDRRSETNSNHEFGATFLVPPKYLDPCGCWARGSENCGHINTSPRSCKVSSLSVVDNQYRGRPQYVIPRPPCIPWIQVCNRDLLLFVRDIPIYYSRLEIPRVIFNFLKMSFSSSFPSFSLSPWRAQYWTFGLHKP